MFANHNTNIYMELLLFCLFSFCFAMLPQYTLFYCIDQQKNIKINTFCTLWFLYTTLCVFEETKGYQARRMTSSLDLRALCSAQRLTFQISLQRFSESQVTVIFSHQYGH